MGWHLHGSADCSGCACPCEKCAHARTDSDGAVRKFRTAGIGLSQLRRAAKQEAAARPPRPSLKRETDAWPGRA